MATADIIHDAVTNALIKDGWAITMDKTTKYRQLIKGILTKYAGLVSKQPEVGAESHLVFDEERDEYLWVQTGWSNQQRTHGVTL
jgi:hypothetical protein